MTLTQPSRLPSLKVFLAHYRNCSDVEEIVVIWSGGPPPDLLSEFPTPHGAAAGHTPRVRIRQEPFDSLNNRFRPDPLLQTRAALQLDDDVIMRCSDVSRAFAAWRKHPQRLVGFFPRRLQPAAQPDTGSGGQDAALEYIAVPWDADKQKSGSSNVPANSSGSYNIVLTKGAFLDATRAFELYWRRELAPARAVVDELHNCEDVLMSLAWAREVAWFAAGSGAGQAGGTSPGEADAGSLLPSTMLYVSPRCFMETERLSSKGISTQPGHINRRSGCAQRFAEMLRTRLPRTEALPAGDRPPLEGRAAEGEAWSIVPGNATAAKVLNKLCTRAGF